ncbi:MAG: helix-turn-helix domain-containing protein [Actinobacteria bacterium]|nr:helix-turn-helix domain-containing protein [Actinomycetota bacterium]
MSSVNLISTSEAAAALKVHRSTLSRMVAAGKLEPALRGEGIRGSMFFSPEEIERAKKQNAALAAEPASGLPS